MLHCSSAIDFQRHCRQLVGRQKREKPKRRRRFSKPKQKGEKVEEAGVRELPSRKSRPSFTSQDPPLPRSQAAQRQPAGPGPAPAAQQVTSRFKWMEKTTDFGFNGDWNKFPRLTSVWPAPMRTCPGYRGLFRRLNLFAFQRWGTWLAVRLITPRPARNKCESSSNTSKLGNSLRG